LTLAGTGLAACALAAPARAEVDETVKQALALHGAGKAEEAYRLLQPQAEKRAGDPDFDYALGLAAADSGHRGEALLALQRVLALQPNNAAARAEIARVYAMSGDVDTARAQFDTVLQDPSLPDPVRQRFTRMVRDYDKQIAGGGSDLSGFLDASAGYDSNINSATDLTQITIPLFAVFGPGALGPGSRASEDGYYEISGGLSAVTAVGRQDRLFASALGSWHDNFESGGFDQGSVTGTAGFAHSFANRDTLSLSGQVQQFWLGTDSYRQAFGAIGQYTHLLDGGRALSVSAQYFRLNFDRQPLLDAHRVGAAITYAERTFVASLSGGHEETVRQAGDAQSNSYADASIGIEQPLGRRLAFVGGVALNARRYDDIDVLFLRKRHDERIDASAGLKLLVADNVYIRPRVTYTRNFSNIALYDYDRLTASVGVRFEF
jgi:hypothetical protein